LLDSVTLLCYVLGMVGSVGGRAMQRSGAFFVG
jgi:hypothetical protein